jgi:hypothetical protein
MLFKEQFYFQGYPPDVIYMFLDNNICKALGSQSPQKTVYKFVFSFLWPA